MDTATFLMKTPPSSRSTSVLKGNPAQLTTINPARSHDTGNYCPGESCFIANSAVAYNQNIEIDESDRHVSSEDSNLTDFLAEWKDSAYSNTANHGTKYYEDITIASGLKGSYLMRSLSSITTTSNGQSPFKPSELIDKP